MTSTAVLALVLIAQELPADTSGAAPAEPTAQTEGAIDVDAVVREFGPGDWVRVRVSDGERTFGRFEQRTGGGFSLHDRSASVDIAIARIDSLWVGRQKTGSGALVGAAIGAALGALVAWGGSELSCEAASGGCDGAPASTWALFVGGGTAVGAGVGAFIGSQSLRWELAFP